jgi:hypothetical protein
MSMETGDTRYVEVGTVPRSVPEGRVLMHNQVRHETDTPSGTRGFRAWTASRPQLGFVRRACGWAHGLTHYAAGQGEVRPRRGGRRW